MPAHISVVIPNLNSTIIGETLEAISCQEGAHPFEVIVVGKDEPGQVQESATVKFVDTGDPAPPAVARNLGVEHARGDLVCFLDADCIPSENWLDRHLAHYADPAVTIVGGGVTFPKDSYWRLADNLATFYPYLDVSPPGLRDQLPSLNLSFRREVWREVGPFDERYPYPAGEDSDWTTRARLLGHDLHFEPRAVVTHFPSRVTPGDLWRHATTFGKYSIKVDERYWPHLGQPIVFRHWLLTLLAAPVMAAWVTGRVFILSRLWRYAHTLPAVYMSKIGWCWGASNRLRGQVNWYKNWIEDDTTT
jgi:glycosyltransferase involved in cell wall biosynthesis